jgi:hypothetical protein
MPVIPTLRRLKEEDHEFRASMGYIKETLSQKPKTKQNRLDVYLPSKYEALSSNPSTDTHTHTHTHTHKKIVEK